MKEENTLPYGQAIAVCAMHLDDPAFTDEMKGLAIHKIMNMETINAVNKETLLKIVRYLWPMAFEWEGGA